MTETDATKIAGEEYGASNRPPKEPFRVSEQDLYRRELNRLASLGGRLVDGVRDIQAMLLAASERGLILNPKTAELIAQLTSDQHGGLAAQMEAFATGPLLEIKEALFTDGVLVTPEQLTELRGRVMNEQRQLIRETAPANLIVR